MEFHYFLSVGSNFDILGIAKMLSASAYVGQSFKPLLSSKYVPYFIVTKYGQNSMYPQWIFHVNINT